MPASRLCKIYYVNHAGLKTVAILLPPPEVRIGRGRHVWLYAMLGSNLGHCTCEGSTVTNEQLPQPYSFTLLTQPIYISLFL